MRVPTQRQYELLRTLGSGGAVVSWTEARARMFVAHGWVADDEVQGAFRLTPAGLRALACAVERYGWPPLAAARPVGRPELPVVTRLRQERDDARHQRDTALVDVRELRLALERVRRALTAATAAAMKDAP